VQIEWLPDGIIYWMEEDGLAAYYQMFLKTECGHFRYALDEWTRTLYISRVK